jgi:RNA polymerase sigma-B factor
MTHTLDRASALPQMIAVDPPVPVEGERRASPRFAQSTAAVRTRRQFRRYHRTRDPRLRDELVALHMPLAATLARRYVRRGDSIDDLLQVAALGLIKAVDRYDEDRGTAFTTFAVPTIVGELRRHLRDHGWALHVPRELQELSLRIDRAMRELTTRLGRSPTPADLAAHLDTSVEHVLEGIDVGANAGRALSLDGAGQGADEDAPALLDQMGDEDGSLDRVLAASTFATRLKDLRRGDRIVVALRFEHNLSQTEIAQRVGISQMQVSRILRRSLERLATTFAEG